MRYLKAWKNIDAVIWSFCVALYARCSTVSSASARSHGEYILLYYILDTEVFASFRLVRCRERRCIMCSMLNCFFNLSWSLTEKTNSRFTCSMLKCFFNLRLCLTENTQTLFIMCCMFNFVFNLILLPHWENTLSYYVFDDQLFHQPHVMPYWENTLSVMC